MAKTSTIATKKSAASMNPNLAKKTQELRTLLRDRTSNDATLTYRVAATVAEIKGDETKYGKGSVKLLARELGYTAANLYACAKVAEVWDHSAFELHLKRVTAKGLPLTFSHFLEIASVPHAEERDALLQKAIDNDLSVREVARAARPPRAAKVPKETLEKLGVLGAAEAAFESAKADLDRLTGALHAGPALTPKELEASIATYEQAIELHENALAELRGHLRQQELASAAAE